MRRVAAAQLALPLWFPPVQLALPLKARKPRPQKVAVRVPPRVSRPKP
ncbi:hypothetical protein [Anaeromyxobacter dehalogenans]|nr:hypothetical protein [Anaeromyxobacter dehalogenans]